MTGKRFGQFGGLVHLSRRFFGSLWPAGPRPADDAWAQAALIPGEQGLWATMSKVDRRHAVGVARQVDTALGPSTERAVLAAALLHDVGKAEARLGAFGRVAATVLAASLGRERMEGRGRIGIYLRHPTIGAARLADAGSDPLTIAWAREHHLPPERWTVPRTVADILKAADDD